VNHRAAATEENGHKQCAAIFSFRFYYQTFTQFQLDDDDNDAKHEHKETAADYITDGHLGSEVSRPQAPDGSAPGWNSRPRYGTVNEFVHLNAFESSLEHLQPRVGEKAKHIEIRKRLDRIEAPIEETKKENKWKN